MTSIIPEKIIDFLLVWGGWAWNTGCWWWGWWWGVVEYFDYKLILDNVDIKIGSWWTPNGWCWNTSYFWNIYALWWCGGCCKSTWWANWWDWKYWWYWFAWWAYSAWCWWWGWGASNAWSGNRWWDGINSCITWAEVWYWWWGGGWWCNNSRRWYWWCGGANWTRYSPGCSAVCYWWWGGGACNGTWWSWYQWVFIISYDVNCGYNITWWNCCYECNGRCIHIFTQDWTLTVN